MADGKVEYEVRANNENLDKDLNESEKKTSSTLGKIGGAAGKAGKAIGASLAAVGSAAIAVGTKALSSATSLDKAMNQFAAATGTADAALAEYEDTLKNIYANNYGESFEDIGNAMATVTQQMGKLDQATLQNVTEGVYALSDVFESDFNETLRGVDQLMTQFGISAEDALDLMATGSQKGLDYTSELGDNIAEYGGKFAQAGYSAEEYFQLLRNGSEGGSYNLDKVNDAINEVTNKLADGSIKESIGIFSGETKKLFESWQKGGASQKQVIDSIVKDINNCTNEQEALTMAATAFGTMGEDANLDFIKSLTSVGGEFDNVKGKMESMKKVKYDDLGSMFEGLMRSLELLLIPLGEALIPILTQLISEIMPQLEDSIGPMIELIAELFAQLAPAISDILPILMELLQGMLPLVQVFVESILPPILDMMMAFVPLLVQIIESILPVLAELLNLLLPPLVSIIETILPPLIALFQALIEPLMALLETILPPFIEIFNTLLEPLMELIDQLLPPLIELFSALRPVIDALTPVIQAVASVMSGVLSSAINAIMPIIEGLMDIFGAVIDFLTGVFTGNWEQAWSGIVNIFKGIFNLIPTIIEAIINGAIGIINGLIQGVNSLIGWLGIGEIPLIAKVKLPRFHTGGIVDFEEGEGLAMLKKGEMVLTQQQQAELFAIANGAAPRGEAMGSDRPLYADITLTGNVEMDGLKVGRVFLRNLDDAAAFTLRG